MKQQVRAPVMIICGIDPGLTGAISRLDAASGELADVVDMPVFELAKAGRKSKTVDAYLVADLLGRGCGHVFVEVQQTRPGPATQAVSKTFTGYGPPTHPQAAPSLARPGSSRRRALGHR
jgi:hypothetical protein